MDLQGGSIENSYAAAGAVVYAAGSASILVSNDARLINNTALVSANIPYFKR